MSRKQKRHVLMKERNVETQDDRSLFLRRSPVNVPLEFTRVTSRAFFSGARSRQQLRYHFNDVTRHVIVPDEPINARYDRDRYDNRYHVTDAFEPRVSVNLRSKYGGKHVEFLQTTLYYVFTRTHSYTPTYVRV